MNWTVEAGWLQRAKHKPSTNFNARPSGCDISLLVVHNISLPPGVFGGGYIEDFFCNELDRSKHPYFETIADVEVSAHLLIARSGDVTQFVSLEERAWHAGQSAFEGRENCNDYSIGIELEGCDDQPFEEIQYQVLSELSLALSSHYRLLSTDRIVGHSDISPGRKTDPGPFFEWKTLKSRLLRR